MKGHLRDLLHDAKLREAISSHGLKMIQKRHTCAHRVDELRGIYSEMGGGIATRPREDALAV